MADVASLSNCQQGGEKKKAATVDALLASLRVKLEPFVQIAPVPATDQVLGFELLGTDRDRRSFGQIASETSAVGLPAGKLRLALLERGLAAVERLAPRMRMDGIAVGALCFTLNLDHELLTSPGLAPLLKARFGEEHRKVVVFEVNEHCHPSDEAAIKNLMVDHGIRIALDDSDKMDPMLRVALADSAELAKLDAFTAIPLLRQRGGKPGPVAKEIERHRLPGKPYVVEGIEDPGFLHFLRRHCASEPMWGQGYAIEVDARYQRYLDRFAPGFYMVREELPG